MVYLVLVAMQDTIRLSNGWQLMELGTCSFFGRRWALGRRSPTSWAPGEPVCPRLSRYTYPCYVVRARMCVHVGEGGSGFFAKFWGTQPSFFSFSPLLCTWVAMTLALARTYPTTFHVEISIYMRRLEEILLFTLGWDRLELFQSTKVPCRYINDWMRDSDSKVGVWNSKCWAWSGETGGLQFLDVQTSKWRCSDTKLNELSSWCKRASVTYMCVMCCSFLKFSTWIQETEFFDLHFHSWSKTLWLVFHAQSPTRRRLAELYLWDCRFFNMPVWS